jgi:hypothetical protein
MEAGFEAAKCAVRRSPLVVCRVPVAVVSSTLAWPTPFRLVNTE